ncbi:MAG: GNAT family N-acetyltransferase [Actinoplanes sp.]
MNVLLRPGTDADLLAVGVLHDRSRATAYAHILDAENLSGPSAEALGEWWSERWKWEKDTHRLTIADEEGEVVGFTYVGPSETDGAAELYAIHVEPRLVGSGVGHWLMVNALDQLAGLGAERAVLWVLAANDHARRFYERGGWQPDGATRTEAVSGQPVPQLRYSLSLAG